MGLSKVIMHSSILWQYLLKAGPLKCTPPYSHLQYRLPTRPSSNTILPTTNDQSAFWPRTTPDSDSTIPEQSQIHTHPASSSTVAQQFAMQTTITKQEMEEQLASLSTLFDMPGSSKLEVPDYGTVAGASNIAHHSRSISSESASSSLAGHDQPARYHPSLGYHLRRVNPEGHVLEQQSAVSMVHRQHTMSTQQRDVPSYIISRNRRHAVPSDDDDDVDEEPLRENATEQERIEYKRRQNTLAARRSRRRRLAQFRQLEEDVARLNREKEIWRERALMMERILSNNGLPCPNFDQ